MNIYQRPLFRQAGGPIAPEMGPMMPPQGMPPAPMAAPQMMPPQGLDPRAAEAVGQVEQGAAMQAEQYGQNMMAGLDAAETPEEVINAMRGNQRPLEARYGELAELVGQEDAQRTPETVLALLQPVMMMTEQGAMDSGIGELMGQLTGNIDMMDESGAPTEMGQGVGSLMMAGVGQQPVANFSQGGAVQRFQVGGEASRLQELYSEMLPVYQGVMGGGEDQRDLTKAQIFFDIADRFGAFAAGIDPRTGERMQGSAAAQFGAAASGLGGQIGERLGAQDQQERALRVAALQGAAGEFSAERADERAAARAAAAGEKDRALGSLYDILDAEGNVLQKGVPIATQGQYAKIVEDNPGIRIVPSRIAEAGFGTTTLYNPETGAPTTFNTETAAGQAAANAALGQGYTTERPAAAGFDTVTLYDPVTGAATTYNKGTAEGRAEANAALAAGATAEKPAEAGFDTITLYDPVTGAATTYNKGTAEGRAEANAALAAGATAEKPAEAGFDTITLYDPVTGAATTYNKGTAEGRAEANAALAAGATAEKPVAAGFGTTTLYNPRTNAATTFNTETAAGQAAANAALAEGYTTEKRPEAGFGATTLYNPVTNEPMTFNTETAAGRAAANAALGQGYTTERPAAAGFDTVTLYDPVTGAATTYNKGTAEGRAAANAALAAGATDQKPVAGPSGSLINIQMPDGSVRTVREDSPEADRLIDVLGGTVVSRTAAEQPSLLTQPDIMAQYGAGTLSAEKEAEVQAEIAANAKLVFNPETGQYEQPTLTPLVQNAEQTRRDANRSTVMTFPDDSPPPSEGAGRERALKELGGAAFGTAPFFLELGNAAAALVDANAPFPQTQAGVDAVNALNQDALIAFREVTGGRTAQEAINQFKEILPTPAKILGSPSSAASEIEQVINLFNSNIQTARESLRTGVATQSQRQTLEAGIISAQSMVRSYQALLQGVQRGAGATRPDPADFRRQ
jgi:hypothetical protein